jgi:hypothetical protein
VELEVETITDNLNAQTCDLYDHVLRAHNMTRYTAKRMDKALADRYLQYIDYIVRYIALNLDLKKDVMWQEVIKMVVKAMDEGPRVENSISNMIFSFIKTDIQGRALAMRHMFDLVYSYRRFQGGHPSDYQDRAMRIQMDNAIVAHLESLSK